MAGDLDEAFGRGVWKPVERGFDHGVWTTLVHLFPNADVPVVSLSLDAGASPEEHYETGRKLRSMRDAGYLVICGGNIVHDLGSVDFSRGPGSRPYPFAETFDEAFKSAVENRTLEALFSPQKMPG